VKLNVTGFPARVVPVKVQVEAHAKVPVANLFPLTVRVQTPPEDVPVTGTPPNVPVIIPLDCVPANVR
jgi:hypothetical protein